MASIAVAGGAIIALGGCNGQVDVGGPAGPVKDGGSPGNGDGAASHSPFDGTWRGYVESYTFPNATTGAMVMTLTFAGDGTVSGTITFSELPAPPPPTNPDIGYPPGYETLNGTFGGNGFVYTVTGGKFDGSRLTLGVVTKELFKAWCDLQTKTYAWVPGVYDCLPNWGGGNVPSADAGSGACYMTDPATHQDVPVDCGKLRLCQTGGKLCACTATSCTMDVTRADTTFDMVVSGTHADGSTTGAFNQHNVHFTHM